MCHPSSPVKNSGGLCCSIYSTHALAGINQCILDLEDDARVLPSGVTCIVSIPFWMSVNNTQLYICYWFNASFLWAHCHTK